MIDNFEKYDKKNIYDRKSIWEHLIEWEIKYSNKTAIVSGNKRVSYKELKEKAERLAKGFVNQGISSGDNVVVQLPNTDKFLVVCFALWAIGARPVLLLPSHRELEIDVIFRVLKPVGYIYPLSFLGFDYGEIGLTFKKNYDCLKKIWAVDIDKDSDVLDEISIYNDEKFLSEVDYSDTALFLLSGGTSTGVPKLIPKVHAAYMYNAKMSAKRCGISSKSVFLDILPISHDLPLCCPGALGTFLSGGTLVLSKTSSFDEVFPLIEKEKVTNLIIVPAIAEVWLEAISEGNLVNLSSVQNILIGAAKLEEETAARLIETFGCNMQQGYGLGEGITCFTSIEDSKDVIFNTQGKPVSTLDEVRIIDIDGKEVEREVFGELIEKGPYTFNGYYKSEEINKKLFTEDGFFKTGDVAKITKEGNIVIKGRMSDSINKAGEKVIPSELENHLLELTQIKDVAVVGVENQYKEQVIVAFVISNSGEIELFELNQYLISKGLSNQKLLDDIRIVESFPRINVGKVDKLALKRSVELND